MRQRGDGMRPATIVAAIALGYLAVLAMLWWRVWWQRRIVGWDCQLEYWPDLVFQIDSLRHGELPLWNPHSLGGYPFAGDVQSGTFSPVSWLCWLASLGLGTSAWLIQLKVTVTIWLGLGGMHALAWSRTRSHAAAAVAAFTYVLGGPLFTHHSGAFLWPLCWLPWAVLAVAAFHARPSARRAALLGLALWAIGSAGHPQSFAYGLAVCGAYGLYLAVEAAALAGRGARGLVDELRRCGPGLALALALAALLLAPIYLPAIDAVGESARASRTASWALGGALPPRSLVELVVPEVDRHWQYDVYMGPLAVLGGLFALAIAPAGRVRRERLFWLAVAIVAVTLAEGRYGGVLPVLVRHVPGFDLFRIPHRYKVVLGLAAAILAGDAVGAVAREAPRRWAREAWLAAGALLLLVTPIIAWRPIAWTAGGATLAALAAAMLDRRRARVWIAIVPALVLVDLWHTDRYKLADLYPVPDRARELPVLAAMAGSERDWRYRVGDIRPPYGGGVPYHAAFVHERRELSGYSNPVGLRRQHDVDDDARPAMLLAHLNVRWYVGGHAPRGAIVRDTTPRGDRVREYLSPAPAVRLYPRAEVLAGDAILERLGKTAPSSLATALVEPDDRPLWLPDSRFAPVDGRVIAFAHQHVAVEIDAPAAGVLVSNELWFPGWSATVDGRPARVFRANYLLRAVVVPAGHHRVDFRFRPRGYPWVLVGFALGLAGALALVARGRSSRARPPPGPLVDER